MQPSNSSRRKRRQRLPMNHFPCRLGASFCSALRLYKCKQEPAWQRAKKKGRIMCEAKKKSADQGTGGACCPDAEAMHGNWKYDVPDRRIDSLIDSPTAAGAPEKFIPRFSNAQGISESVLGGVDNRPRNFKHSSKDRGGRRAIPVNMYALALLPAVLRGPGTTANRQVAVPQSGPPSNRSAIPDWEQFSSSSARPPRCSPTDQEISAS